MFIKWYFTQLELWNADWKFKMAAIKNLPGRLDCDIVAMFIN
jgi:hypothetical protein